MDEFKSILLHLDASPRAAQRLRRAAQLASAQGAALEVLYAVDSAFTRYPIAASADGETLEMLARLDVERRAGARALFEQERAELGLTGLRWDATEDNPIAAFQRRALQVDLLVLGQAEPDGSEAQVSMAFAPSVLIESGKPALVLPYTDRGGELGHTILIAWKNSAASARAVTAALPMLRRARKLHIASWGDSAAADLAEPLPVEAFLAHHHIVAEVHRFARATAGTGELMLSMAADVGADLLVMGCYGHSRAREWLLGGATRTMLQSMTLPVLMSH